MSAQCVRPRYARSAYWSLAYGKARVAAAAIGIYATPIQNSRVAASEYVPGKDKSDAATRHINKKWYWLTYGIDGYARLAKG